MIYILFICILVFFVIDMVRLRRMGKHDDVLFPLCQLRRDVMEYRYESIINETWTLEENDLLRRLSRTLDATISNYDKHKTVMFNLRKVAKHLETYRHTADPLPEISENPKIREFQERFGRLLVKAFIAYTPLIRSELALRMIAFAYRAGKKEGARRAAEYVVSNARKVRNDARRYGLSGAGAAA